MTTLCFDYNRVESIISKWIEEWRECAFNGVVAIARGGLPAGVMAASGLSLPLYALAYDRPSRTVTWFSNDVPRPNSKLLLIEDIAGCGTTLIDSIAFLLRSGFGIRSCTIVSDTKSAVIPDFSVKLAPGYRARFPWEREAVSPTFPSSNLVGACEREYAFWASDLDGVLLHDIPDAQYLEDIDKALSARDKLAFVGVPSIVSSKTKDLTIITGRPEKDRHRTLEWMALHGLNGNLYMRDEALHSHELSAEHKADVIKRLGVTHFIESCSRQAIMIASLVPCAEIFWFDIQTRTSRRVLSS